MWGERPTTTGTGAAESTRSRRVGGLRSRSAAGGVLGMESHDMGAEHAVSRVVGLVKQNKQQVEPGEQGR